MFMKKLYETPTIEKVMFVSEEKVCAEGGTMFSDYFPLSVVSDTLNFTNEAIFKWEEFENSAS